MLYKRSKKPGAYWWVRFECRGAYVRQSSGTDRKELAQAFERELREAIWNEQNLGIEVHTWEEACERWLKEKAHKRSLLRDKQAIKRLDLSGELAALVVPTAGAREMATYRSILNACVKWGWLDRAPKVEMPHAEKSDPRWITKAQFAELCKELPHHAAQLARFAVSTGLRQRNIFRLQWSAVDLGQRVVRVAPADSKTGKAIGVPLSHEACAILKRQSGAHRIYVFGDHRGHAPIGSIKTCWLKAVDRAGLPGFRFHDLRHTWAAWHVLAGTPPTILKELGGWASLAMVERYGHIGTGHLGEWADNSSIRKRHGNAVSKRRILVDARDEERARVSPDDKDQRSGPSEANSKRIRKSNGGNDRKPKMGKGRRGLAG